MPAPKLTDQRLQEFISLDIPAEDIAEWFRPISLADVQARIAAILAKQDKAQRKRSRPQSLYNERQKRLAELRKVIRRRPLPPEELFAEGADCVPFVASPELRDWIAAIFIDPSGELTNDRHEHLLHADIGVLWTSVANSSKGMRILAQAESPFPRGDKWSKGRQLWQLEQWFGTVPDFVLTFDAHYALEADDWQFCATCEHELCHCAQMLDEEGCPRVNEETGKPLFRLVGHDVEEFVTVVERYGAKAARVEALVEAANNGPYFEAVDIEGACGTCLK